MKSDLVELARLLRTHLEEEYSPYQRLFVDADSYAFFRQQAQQQIKTQSKQPPQPKQVAPITPPIKAATLPPPPPIKPQPKPNPQPKQEIKEVQKIEEQPKNQFFNLEPMPKAGLVDLGAVPKTFETLFPQLYIADLPKQKQPNRISLFILCCETAHDKLAFLKEMARALFTIYGHVRMISLKQISEAQGILLAPHHLAEELKDFKGNLVFLDDIDLYLKEPSRKATLWNRIKPLCANM